MRKISLLTVILIAALVLCMGTASAQTASVGYKGIMATGAYGEYDSIIAMNGLSFRGWVDQIGWEGTLFFGRQNHQESRADGYIWERDEDAWALQVQAMYAIITHENSKLYVGVNAAYGQANSDRRYSYPDGGSYDHYKYETDFWSAGPVIGAQYSFQGIPELSFCWDLGYTFVLADTTYTDDYKTYNYNYDYDDDTDGVNVSLGVHYAF